MKIWILSMCVLASAIAWSQDEKKSNAKPLFDGKTLTGWKVADFAGRGEVTVAPEFKGKESALILASGYMTGITFTNAFPKTSYEVTLEAMRVEGSDFFCGLTFPVKDSHCSFIVGGWGGGLVGLSSLNGSDASENETTKYMKFENGKWYRIRVRVTTDKIEAWIDDEKMADVSLADNKVSTRIEVELNKPFGFASWHTKAALKNIQLKEGL